MEHNPKPERSKMGFSIWVHFYVWVFFAISASLPLFIGALKNSSANVSHAYWAASLVWTGVIGTLFWYASMRCFSARLSFLQGLLLVTSSMMTGWAFMSLFTVLPALLVVFCGSAAIALYGELGGNPAETQKRWLRLIGFFHRNRMLQ